MIEMETPDQMSFQEGGFWPGRAYIRKALRGWNLRYFRFIKPQLRLWRTQLVFKECREHRSGRDGW
jgi:hypothetical protein